MAFKKHSTVPFSLGGYFRFVCLESGTYHVAQVGLELLVLGY